ncbi:hypothetical protein JFL43_06300 [Viridibacillus sp. YIM B01967]|uniref:Uncharacterized protein n=1 Tax=Viridibacillus soli TaxID=2798301 RepID=A0ABS1H500_9BACL|nr:hypothetical protein [Viridibacillus soli]MBK3494477.1 hypothetical protein [Viridibacillus soli]
MNKKFITNFKDWWKSLFRKGAQENISESTDELIESDDTQENGIMQNEAFNQNDIDIQMKLPKQPIIPMYNGKYDQFFLTPELHIPLSAVNEELWDLIQEKLPDNYTIPCATSKHLYNINKSRDKCY